MTESATTEALVEIDTSVEGEAEATQEIDNTGEDTAEPEQTFAEFAAEREAKLQKDKQDRKDKNVKDSVDAKAKVKAEETEGEDTSEEGASKEPKEEPKAKQLPEEIEYTVDGEKFKVAAKDVPNLLAKVAGADKRFNEAANIRKETQQFVETLKANPIEALKRAGIDFEQLAVDHVYDKLSYEELSPEAQRAHDNERRLEELQKDNERYQERDRVEQERIEQEKHHLESEQRIVQAQEALGNEIMAALDNSTIPKDKFSISRMALYMKEGLSRGVELSAAEVLSYVEQDYQEMRENERRANVDSYKAEKKNTYTSKGSKAKPKSKKRITSIYDLLD